MPGTPAFPRVRAPSGRQCRAVAFQWACSQCDKVLTTPRGKRDHVRWHNGVRRKRKPVTCARCTRIFASQYNMQRHIRTQHPEAQEPDSLPPTDLSGSGSPRPLAARVREVAHWSHSPSKETPDEANPALLHVSESPRTAVAPECNLCVQASSTSSLSPSPALETACAPPALRASRTQEPFTVTGGCQPRGQPATASPAAAAATTVAGGPAVAARGRPRGSAQPIEDVLQGRQSSSTLSKADLVSRFATSCSLASLNDTLVPDQPVYAPILPRTAVTTHRHCSSPSMSPSEKDSTGLHCTSYINLPMVRDLSRTPSPGMLSEVASTVGEGDEPLSPNRICPDLDTGSDKVLEEHLRVSLSPPVIPAATPYPSWTDHLHPHPHAQRALPIGGSIAFGMPMSAYSFPPWNDRGMHDESGDDVSSRAPIQPWNSIQHPEYCPPQQLAVPVHPSEQEAWARHYACYDGNPVPTAEDPSIPRLQVSAFLAH